MADNEIRNPAKAYFKWKMPVITKSEDDWNFWNTEDKYNRTMFIGYNDTTTPHVASLFIIVDGKPMQAVGDDVIARIAGLETNTAQALADIQALIDRVNAQQLEISNLQRECQRILEDAESAVRAAQVWAEGTDAQVADRGGEHSAKGWAQKANDIVASGLPSDATFDHLTVTGSSKFGQDPDRQNQPGLEIEGTGEIQAYRTVNMMNGATVSYDETVEMPWSDSSNKVPNTAWVQQAVMHGTIDPNTELTIKALTLTNGILKQDHTKTQDDGTYKNPKVHFESDAEKFWVKCEAMPDHPRSIELLMMPMYSDARQENFTVTAKESTTTGKINLSATSFSISVGDGTCGIGGSTAHGKKDITITAKPGNLFIPSVAVSENSRKLAYAATTKYVHDAIKADSAEITADFQPKLTAGEGIEISADNVISATGGGSGAVTSVNGKTGEVVLAATDVGAAPADALANYVTTDAMNTELAGKQDKLTAESDLAVNNLTAASVSSSGTIKSANADSSKYAQIASAGLTYSSTGADNYMHDITDYGLRLRNLTSGGDHKATLIAGLSGSNACLQSKDGFVFQQSPMAALDPRPTSTYLVMAGDNINLIKNTICSASMPAATDSSTTVPTTEWVQGAITAKTANLQPKLTAGDGITISETNVISATSTGGAVNSVNGKTGAVVLTGEDVNVDTTEGAATVKAAIAAKQDAITAGTDMDVRSVKAHSTVVQGETTTQYTMYVTGNGFELTDATNNISWVRLTPTELNVPSLVANGAPGVDTLLTCYGQAKIGNLSSIGEQWDTGAFNWDINTTTDYNKFEVYNLYFTDDAETGQKVPNRSVLFSIGGSPTDHSTWVDFTANYLSFKGDTNFGETGMNHNMNFNGTSRFMRGAGFYNTVVLGHGETTVEGEGGTPTTIPASSVYVDGDLETSGSVLFGKGFTANDSISIMGNTTFWKVDAEGGSIPFAGYDKSTGAFNIDYLTSTDGGTSANRVTIMADSREANYGATFNLPVTVSDASFKRTSTLAADDNSTEVPTTAWVKAAIAAEGGVPDDITCKTLKVTNWDGELDSIEFAGNLKYSGDSGNGSLGKITANELFTNSSGYYGTRIRASGITLTHGSGSTTWFNADSSTQKLTITGDTTVSGTSTVHILNAGDGTDGQKFNCNADASFGYNVNIGWTSGRLKCMRDEYNWLFDFNRNASPGSMLKFNDTVTILSAMPAATDSSNKVPTTAWVQGAITAKAAAKPTIHVQDSSNGDEYHELWVSKSEDCSKGRLLTAHYMTNCNIASAYLVPEEFADGIILSAVCTSNDANTTTGVTATLTGRDLNITIHGSEQKFSCVVTIFKGNLWS